MDYELIHARETILQSLLMINDNMISHVTVYVSVVFAYAAVAYIAGSKLSRLQLSLTTVIFILVSSFEIFNIVLLNQSQFVKLGQLAEFGGPVPDPPMGTSVWPAAIIWSSGTVAALIFMWSVRRNKTE